MDETSEDNTKSYFLGRGQKALLYLGYISERYANENSLLSIGGKKTQVTCEGGEGCVGTFDFFSLFFFYESIGQVTSAIGGMSLNLHEVNLHES